MLFDDTYNTIQSTSEAVFRDKGSKFIAIAIPVNNETDAKSKLDEIRKKYYDATHHCFAYRISHDKSIFRSNDDGEPSGTAGKPIYNQILSKDLTNILIIVVRYFGGTKFGVSGLINAYKTAAKESLDNARIITKTVKEINEITYGYELMSLVMKFLKDEKIEQLSHEFRENCNIIIALRKSKADEIRNKLKAIQGINIKFLRIE
jgi:uncharacterized YigZ family protein